MSIRLGRASDRKALAALDRRAWTLITNPILPDGELWLDAKTDLANTLVAEEERAVVGYVQLGDALPARLETARHVGRIRGIAVLPEHRGKGIGAALLEAVQAQAARRHYQKLVLQVMGSNLRAQRLYERTGFVCEGRITGLFLIEGKLVDDLWYAKWVKPPEPGAHD